MFLKKIIDLRQGGKMKKADLLILEGDVILEAMEKTKFRWNGPNSENEELEFEKAFQIRYKDFNAGIRDCTYMIHSRKFTDLSFMFGENAVEAGDGYEVREYPDGRKFLIYCSEKPTFDFGDREWDSKGAVVVYSDEAGVNLIACSYGYKIPRIDIYLGLQKSGQDFARFVEYLM